MVRNYIILAYKLPDQMARMIRRLSDGDQTYFYVHVDRNFDMEPFEKACRGIQNVFFLTGSSRVHSYWGDFSTTQAALNAMAKIIGDHRSGVVILLSGQDYPIRGNRAINDFFEKHPDSDFSVNFSLPSPLHWKSSNHGRNRLEHYHVSLHRPGRAIEYVEIQPWCFSSLNLKKCLYVLRFRPDLAWRLPIYLFHRRSIPRTLTYYGSETWWVMRVSSAAAILDFLAHHPDIISYFREVAVPEEIFFASILKSLPETRDQVVDSSLRLICWDNADSSSPLLFNSSHKDKILEARKREDMLFARKFDQTVDSGILDWLDQNCAD